MAKDVLIKLGVDAHVLYPLANNPVNVNANCELKDDNNGCIPSGTNIEDFVSTVYYGKWATWEGYTLNELGQFKEKDYSIIIDSIDYEYGIEVLANKKNKRKDKSKKTNAKVKECGDDTVEEEEETYMITFSIRKKNSDTKTFTIDPKLKGYN